MIRGRDKEAMLGEVYRKGLKEKNTMLNNILNKQL